jgi:outer membrane lipoprotein carrier protein
MSNLFRDKFLPALAGLTLVLLAGFLTGHSAAAETGEPPREETGLDLAFVLENMRKADEGLACFEAAFKETLVDAILKDEEISRGTLYYQKPDRVKWVYESPGNKEFVLRKKEAWLYVPRARQVQKIRLSDEKKFQSLPLGLGKSPEEAGAGYSVRLLETIREEGKVTHRLELVPKADAESPAPWHSIVLDIEEGLWIPACRIELTELGGNRTIIELDAVNKTKKLPAGLFKMPKGVSVVDYSK